MKQLLLGCLIGFAVVTLSACAENGSSTAATSPPSGADTTAVKQEMGRMSGSWAGTYSYPDARASVDFSCGNLVQQGNKIYGTLTEPRSNFGPDVPSLSSSIVGSIDSDNVTFTKTYFYDGHKVIYIGTYDPDTRTITGTWHIGAYEGTFGMHKDGHAVNYPGS